MPCSAKTRADLPEHGRGLAPATGTASVYLPGGRPPRVGERLRQPELAATLRRLADDLGAFYEGGSPPGRRLAHRRRARRSPVTSGGWPASAPPEPAIEATYGGLRLHETPPPSAGWMVLHAAGSSTAHWPAADSSMRRPCTVRRGGAGVVPPPVGLLRRGQRGMAHRVSRRSPSARRDAAVPAWPGHRSGRRGAGDTTSTVCVDAEGTAVSFIHSLALTFGSRTTVPGTGVVLNNRLGRGAYLIDGHPNEVRPRRKPLHTLNAWLARGRPRPASRSATARAATGRCSGTCRCSATWSTTATTRSARSRCLASRSARAPTRTPSARPPSCAARQAIPEETLPGSSRAGHRVARLPRSTAGPAGRRCVSRARPRAWPAAGGVGPPDGRGGSRSLIRADGLPPPPRAQGATCPPCWRATWS